MMSAFKEHAYFSFAICLSKIYFSIPFWAFFTISSREFTSLRRKIRVCGFKNWLYHTNRSREPYHEDQSNKQEIYFWSTQEFCFLKMEPPIWIQMRQSQYGLYCTLQDTKAKKIYTFIESITKMITCFIAFSRIKLCKYWSLGPKIGSISSCG